MNLKKEEKLSKLTSIKEYIVTFWMNCGSNITLQVAFSKQGDLFIIQPHELYTYTDIFDRVEELEKIYSEEDEIYFPAKEIETGFPCTVFLTAVF